VNTSHECIGVVYLNKHTWRILFRLGLSSLALIGTWKISRKPNFDIMFKGLEASILILYTKVQNCLKSEFLKSL